jgi:hypothetical protein
MSDEVIDVCVEVNHETDSAYLVTDGFMEDWIPKSQIIDETEHEDGCITFVIPEWLALEKGFI